MDILKRLEAHRREKNQDGSKKVGLGKPFVDAILIKVFQ
jgi:hypothetical protein